MSKSALDPLDLFDVRSELNEEEAMLQAAQEGDGIVDPGPVAEESGGTEDVRE